jgi:hypothetical protein
MSMLGTDIVALGCILGGAAIGGAATLAMMDGDGHADVGCEVEAMAVNQTVAISHRRDAGAIVVMPDVRVHAVRDCVGEMNGVVEIRLNNHLEQLDAQLEHLDHALEIELRQMELQLEAEFGQEMEARIQFEEAMRQVEEARVKVIVKKIEGGGI